jgi:hypothetical protein
MPFISKSKFLWGLQCQKLRWHAYNAKNLIPKPDDSQQAIFDQGHEVGALAKLLFPGGIEVGQGIVDIETVLILSQSAIKQRRPLLEAAFAFDGGYARVDILNPVDDDAWDIIPQDAGLCLAYPAKICGCCQWRRCGISWTLVLTGCWLRFVPNKVSHSRRKSLVHGCRCHWTPPLLVPLLQNPPAAILPRIKYPCGAFCE